jgi:Carboxypeptidase regulatory-like domain/TonB dependent receptor-like, beta-barrel
VAIKVTKGVFKMQKRVWFALALGFFLLVSSVPGFCQGSTVKGAMAGTVYDTTGAVVPAARITVTGPIGSLAMDTNSTGNFMFQNLSPGTYQAKVEKAGFKVAQVSDIDVTVNNVSTIHVTLVLGTPTQVIEVAAPAVRVDATSTRVTTGITDTFYDRVPLPRNVSGLFYVAPGVANGGGTGESNPSISGGSGLENLYVADGVNITDAAFGGLGVFSRVFGSVGSGINMAFVQEVDIKTGGFEPQYGQATGGVVQIVTKSGGSEYHGGITAYFQPQRLEATRLQADDFGLVNLTGKTLHTAGYDLTGELGGPVPGVKDHLFFFASADPSWNRRYDLAPPVSALFAHGTYTMPTDTYNYAGKLTWKISDSHQFEASLFGDPSHTGTDPWRSLTADNNTRFSSLKYGTRNLVGRYTGTLSPTWLVNADITWDHNTFTETPITNLNEIIDQTQVAGLPGQRGSFTPVGIGYLENTRANTYTFDVSTTKMFNFAGSHTFSIGYHFEAPHYGGSRDYTGPRSAIPATNEEGTPLTSFGVDQSLIGTSVSAEYYLLRAPSYCTLCPLMNVPGYATPQGVYLRQVRGIFGTTAFETKAKYNAAYVEDAWKLNKYLTLDLGMRYEQQRLTGNVVQYSFTDNWLPRIGVTFDPTGDRRTKIYANFGRYDYVLPLDVAERSLSTENDFYGSRLAPDFTVNGSGQRVVTINQNGTVTPILDATHTLNEVGDTTGGVCNTATGCGIPSKYVISTQGAIEAIAPGTKMEFEDEYMVGLDRELGHGVIFSVRYIDRRLRRIIEDTGGISPEAGNAGISQYYAIANVGASTDLFTNPIEHTFSTGQTFDFTHNSDGYVTNLPASLGACLDPTTGLPPYVDENQVDTFGNVIGSACFNPTGVNGQTPGIDIPDGVADGFPNPVRNYDAVEIEFNKSFSRNWMMRANWRIARLYGNFEGAFRNDNGQSDPGISSLYDFTAGQMNLLGDQFKPGVLNTDRTHIVNFYTAYVMPRGPLAGLTFGPAVTFETGTPINDLKAHPIYQNAGEIPVGGRGVNGREKVDGQVNMHLDYPFRLSERFKLRVGADFFNIANSRTLLQVNQDEDLGFGVPNADYLKPLAGRSGTFVQPFHMRGMVRLEF